MIWRIEVLVERIVKEEEFRRTLEGCRFIIDARSPGEFAEDHIPGAINVPMLDNEQRAEVGTLHRENAFEARKLGAIYATMAINRFLQSPLIRQAGRSQSMMVYCARGGQRSGALALVLSQIGYPVFRLERGYKTYRSWLLESFQALLPQPVFVLHGHTGSQKTRLILALAGEINILDLEGYAQHRGSVLGGIPNQAQPTQRAFETRLMQAILGLAPNKPTLIEGESRRIGRLSIPDPFWTQMNGAIHLWLDIPRKLRVNYILEDYHDLKNTSFLDRQMARLAPYIDRKTMAGLHEDMTLGRWEQFVDTLLEAHYDPLYQRSFNRGPRELIAAESFEEARLKLLHRIQAEAAQSPGPEIKPARTASAE